MPSTKNWGFYNDGDYSYEDHIASWYSDTQIVQAQKGIDIGIAGVRNCLSDNDRPTVVALVDTGVYAEHPDLSGRLWVNADEIAGDGIDNDENGFVDDVNGWNFYDGNPKLFSRYSNTEDSHGTHCASLMNAEGSGVVGVCTGSSRVKVMPVKVLGGASSSGSVANVIQAIRYAEANGAVICNLSIGFQNYNEDLYQVMKNSHMLFVVAAGNGGSNSYGAGWNLASGKRYPACYDLDNMIVTANLKCDGTLHYSSCYGADYVDIAVPGTKLYAASSPSGYDEMTGTSMSAAILSGIAAFLYSHHPEWEIIDVKNAILGTVHALPALENKVRTGGIPNVTAAMKWPETPTDDKQGGEQPPAEDDKQDGEQPPAEDDKQGGEQPPVEDDKQGGEQPPAEDDKQDDGKPSEGDKQDDGKPSAAEKAKIKKAVSGYPKVKYVSQTSKKLKLKLRGNNKADGIQVKWKQKSGAKKKTCKAYISARKSKWITKSLAKCKLTKSQGKTCYGTVTKISVRYYKKSGGKYYYGSWKSI